MATKSRKLINKIMDLLEKGMDVEQLKPLVNEVNAEMSAMRRVMRAMHMSLPPEKKVPAKKGR